MNTLLRIDASANPGRSASAALTGEFAAAWQAARPVSAVIHRDLGAHAPPALDRALLAALWAKPGADLPPATQAARAASDALVDEFLAADAFVLGAPMYNFSVPAGLKAWIDHVARFGKTLLRGPSGTEPVRKGRKALVIATRAGDFSRGGPRDGWDFLEPYLDKVLRYLGLVPEILPVVQGRGGPDADALRLAEARARLEDVLRRWDAAERDAGVEPPRQEAA